MFRKTLDRCNALIQRGSFFASHCRARISAYDPLTFFFGTELLTNGGVSAALNEVSWLGGRLAGYFTLAYYFRSLYQNMNANLENHPDSIDLTLKRIELCRNSRNILFSLRQNKEITRDYLQARSSLTDQDVKQLLDAPLDALDDLKLLQFFTLYRQIHHMKHPFVKNHTASLKAGIAHGYPHLIESMLFKSFAGMNLYDDSVSPEKVICYLLLLTGVYSVYQTYAFNLVEKKPTSYDLMTCFAKDTGFFSVNKEEKETAPLLPKKPSATPECTITVEPDDIDSLVYQEALIDAFAPCCLKAHGF